MSLLFMELQNCVSRSNSSFASSVCMAIYLVDSEFGAELTTVPQTVTSLAHSRSERKFLPCRPQCCRARDQQNPGEKHSDPRPIPRAPAERGQDQEIDRRVFQEIDAVGEQRDRADRQRHGEFHAEIAKVERSHQPNRPS